MIAKGSGYVRGNRETSRARLGAHFKYTEHRSRDEEKETRDDRRIYSKDEDVVSRQDATDDIMEHTSTNVNYHKMVLSPGEDEPVQDWREWTRDVMHDLEEEQGKELHWYAVNHNNTDHPHVHMVVAGAGEDHETGETEPVKLYKEDYAVLRESGHEHSEYEHYHRISDLVKEYDAQEQREQPSQERDPGKELSSQDHSIDRGDYDR